MNLYYDPDRCKFDEEKYNNVENDFPGFKRFFECFSRFNDKINVDQMSEIIINQKFMIVIVIVIVLFIFIAELRARSAPAEHHG